MFAVINNYRQFKHKNIRDAFVYRHKNIYVVENFLASHIKQIWPIKNGFTWNFEMIGSFSFIMFSS